MLNVRALLTGTMDTPAKFAAALLQHSHVAVVPGEAFGDADHVRLSYATDMDSIREGMRRIAEFAATLP